MADQTFTSGQVLTASQMSTLQANIGLTYISSTTIGAGVTTVSVASCFSATYDNYRIVISNMVASNDGSPLLFKLNNSTGSTYSTLGTNMDFGSNTVYGAAFTSTGVRVLESSTTINSSIIDVFMPFTASITTMNSCWTGNSHVGWYNGRDTNAVSQTGCSITISAGTITGGTIVVYGYRKA